MFGIFRKPIKPSKAKSTKKNNNTKSVTFFSKFLYGSLVILVWGTILLVPLVVYYAYDLPDISNLEQNNTKSTIMVMAQNGDVISTYGNVYGEWLDYQEIPINHIEAVIAIEDKRFFDHRGLDLRGLARAIVSNLIAGRMVEGGSTISQQLAKNLYLSADRTFKRKVQE
ncbi:MAG: transglycosylase domain-containing protein, partial [Kordiimonadaceae bacterium]|nr:transglycosylase domain-containing protein [Kordiimonadaceae bacterium]